MKIFTLFCNHCGASLEVLGKTKFLACTYWGTSLKVQESGGAAYTEAIEALEIRTAHIQDNVQTLKLQNELERLDREWYSACGLPLQTESRAAMADVTPAASPIVTAVGDEVVADAASCHHQASHIAGN